MKKLLLLVIGFTLVTTSCDDFLTENPKHEQVLDNVVTDYQSAQNIVNGVYSTYEGASYLGGYLQALMLGGQAGLWNYWDNPFYLMTYRQGNTSDYYSPTVWQNIYSCINAANAAIAGITPLDDALFPSPEAKEELIAEARCFRGFMNLYLVWFFSRWFDDADSPYGIIYRDQPANLANLMQGRLTVGESYQKVLDDLTYAEQHLGDYESARYVSKQFAQVLHAKLLLVRGWEGDYAEALKIVEDVMATAPATFAMESDITQLYDKAWDSNEVLFARYVGDLTERGSTGMSVDYCYSAGLYDVTEFTDIPTAWLKADPRYAYIVGEAYGPQQWQVDAGRKEDEVLIKLYRGGNGMDPYGKYCTYVFRYPELYLMKAELLARTNPGDIAGALAPLNEMRALYTVPKLEPVSATTYQQLMDAIFKEYVVTLFLENETEWFASIRFTTSEGTTWLKELKGTEINYTEDQYCWPIPEDEIKAHDNPIAQNPGLE